MQCINKWNATGARSHIELPQWFESCKHWTPQKFHSLSLSLFPCVHCACLGAVFFLDYQFYFSVSCELPRLAYKRHNVRIHTLFIYIVMPTCLIYCCTRIPKMGNTTTPQYKIPHRIVSTQMALSLSLSLAMLILCLNLIVIRNTFSRLANSSLCPFHIHVLFAS